LCASFRDAQCGDSPGRPATDSLVGRTGARRSVATAALLVVVASIFLATGGTDGSGRSGSLFVYVSSADSGSVGALSGTHGEIAAIAPTYFHCSPAHGVAGSDVAILSGEARRRGIALLPRFSCVQPALVAAILNRRSVANRIAATLCRLAREQDYDGLSVDFERGDPTDRDRFTRFIQSVATCMHSEGRLVSVYVAAKTDDLHRFHHAYFYDYSALARAADTVFVAAWGVHWSTSRPGPIDPLPWVAGVARYIASLPLRGRFVLGFAAYALDWRLPTGHAGRALGSSQALALAAAVGGRTQFDRASYSPYFRYRDRSGELHVVWYADLRSIAARLRIAREQRLAVGFWRLGQEPDGLWSLPELSSMTCSTNWLRRALPGTSLLSQARRGSSCRP
jgi:spore germination protein YaaH